MSSSSDDTDSDNELSTPPTKRQRSDQSITALKGAATYKTAYNPEWEKYFPISVANGNKYARRMFSAVTWVLAM